MLYLVAWRLLFAIRGEKFCISNKLKKLDKETKGAFHLSELTGQRVWLIVAGRGSRVQSSGRGSKVAVAGPMSRSRVQSRGRGSNVAAGENDLEFEVTEWKRVIWKKYKGQKIVFMHDTLR